MTQSVCVIFADLCIPMPGFNITDVCTYASPACPFKSGIKETVTVYYPEPKATPIVSDYHRFRHVPIVHAQFACKPKLYIPCTQNW